MTAPSTDTLLIVLVGSTLAMLATWALSRRGMAGRRLAVIACAFFAGASIGTTFALAARTPWLWSFIRVPEAVRTEAVASGRPTPALLPPVVPNAALVSPAAEPAPEASNRPEAVAPQRSSNPPRPQETSTAAPQTKASSETKTGSARTARLESREQHATPAPSPDRAPSTWERRGGTVATVDGLTLTLEEIGPWTGTSTRPTRTSITMTSQTRIELVERSREATAQDRQGSFRASPLARSDIRAGDYVTVTTRSTEGRHIATSITVVRASESRPEPKTHVGANATPADPVAPPQARRSGDTASPRLSGESVSVAPPTATELARPRAEGRPEDGSSVIDWLLQR
jgi:hypothetical protein